jgi:hypothetical protein
MQTGQARWSTQVPQLASAVPVTLLLGEVLPQASRRAAAAAAPYMRLLAFGARRKQERVVRGFV